MKMIMLFLLALFIGTSCSENESETIDYTIIGIWVEKNPELFDSVADTLVFTENYKIEKHFYYNGFNYLHENDSIKFYDNSILNSYSIDFNNANEIVINNFIDRLLTAEVKNIQFIKAD